MKKWILSAVIAATVILPGCSSDDDSFKVGVMAGSEADLMKTALVVAEKKYGLKAELVEFGDYITPNIALEDGSIDVNAFQHKPYLDSMVKDRGFKLKPIAHTFVYPIGGYSSRIENISELKEGALVAIPNDPTNEGRALLLMDQAGLITLKSRENLEATPVDIIENPKKLTFMELDAAQLPRSLQDVDLAFINSTFAVPAGLLPTRDAIILEDADSPYVNWIVAREDNATDPRVQELVKAYQSDVVKQKAEEVFKGAAVAGW